jgi:hypothetical protein
MTKLALMPTAAFGMPNHAASPIPALAAIDVVGAFAGAASIREARMVTSPVATGHVSVAAVAADAHLTWDYRQAKSAKWTRPPRGETP